MVADDVALPGEALETRLVALAAALPQLASAAGTEQWNGQLQRLEALATWQERACRDRVTALLRGLRSLARLGVEQRRRLLPQGLRLVYQALGPAWRQAPVLAVLSGQGRRMSGTHRQVLAQFISALPVQQPAQASMASARAVLRAQVQEALRAVADVLAAWPPGFPVCLESGLAARLRGLRLAAQFLGSDAAGVFARLEGLYLLASCCPPCEAARADVARLLQQAVWRLSLGRDAARELDALSAALPCVARGADSADLELVAGFSALRQWLQESATDDGLAVNEALLFESLRLAWVLEAQGQPLLAGLLRVFHELCSAYWYRCLPLPLTLQAVVRELLEACGTGTEPVEPLCVAGWLSELLAGWPPEAQLALPASVQVRDAEGRLLPPCRLEDLPARLAEALGLVPEAGAAWYLGPEQWQAQAPELERDLILIEQGAAALRLSALERYCALLLEVRQLLSCAVNLPFPAGLLRQCHEALLAQLDRAAQWLEPRPAEAHVAAVQDWAQRATAALAETAGLQARLLQVLRPAARLLDRSLRLRLNPPPGVAETPAGEQCFHAALALLRWLLACSDADMRSRRSSGLPQALDVALHCPEPRRLLLEEPWSGRLPDTAELRRLQRKTGALSLTCHPLPGGGRCFDLLLA